MDFEFLKLKDEEKDKIDDFEFIIPTQFGAGASAVGGATLAKPPPDILQTSPVASGVLGISEPLDLDKINKYVAAPLKGISHGIYSAPQAIGGLMRNLGEVSGELKTAPKIFMGGDEKYKELIEAKTKSPEIEVDKLIASKGQDIIKANREFLEAKKLSTKGEDKVEDFLFNLGSGATSLAGAIGISVLTGSPHAAAVAFGLYQKGTLYQEAREAGVGVKKAEALSTVGGVIEGALEYIGLELLFSKMGGGALVNTVMHAGTEGFQEFSQTVGENIVAKIGWDGQRNVLQGAGESALIGALLGAPASVITSNAEKGIDLQNITEQEKHQLIAKIIEKQLGAIGATLQNLNPATIMEKVKTDPDIQKAIIGVLQGEVFEPVTLGKEAEEPPTPKALEPLAEEARKYGSAEEFERAVYKKEKDLMEFYYDEAKKIKSTPTSIEADAEKSHKDIISNLNKWQVLEKKAEKQKEILWNMPKYKGINLTDFYKQAAAKPVGEGERVDLSRPDVLWHSSPSGDLRGSHYGLHIGTKKAAEQALYARIGVPADGKGWNGTSEYGKTLLAGKETLKKLGIDNTGFNVDIPENDFYPKEGIAKYSSGEIVSLKAKPTVMPVKIKGEMTNTPYTSMEDFKANSIMQGQLKRGSAKRGYYYKNASEDEGSVSAVVPGSEHLEILQQPTPVPKPEVKPEPTKKDFEALKTTDKNKELFYEKYNNVYTETKKGYDRLIEGRIAELKEEGFKGIEKGGLKKTEEGEVVGSYPAISNNPKWYRDFYKANDRQPTNKDLREIAIKQLSEGYVGDYGEVSANKIFTTLNTQLETLDIVLSDIKEGNYSFEVSGNTLKLNKELDKLRKEIGKVKKDYEAQLAKQITESQKKFIKLSGELAKQKEISVKKDLTKIKSLESERQKAGEAIEKLKSKLKEVKSKIIKPKKKSIKTLAREFSGQIDKKIEIAENEILQLVLRGEAKAARKAFSLGKKEGIFTQKEHFTEVVARLKERVAQKGYIDKLIKDINKLPTQNMAVDYKEMIEDIQGEFDLKKRTAKTIARRARLANYIEKQAELDHDVDIPQDQIDMIRKKPLNDMTIEELETVHDNIMHLAHLGKTKGKLLKVAEKRSVEKQVDTLIDTITKGEGITIKDVIKTGKEDKTFFQRAKEAGQTYHYNTVRAERLFEQADNFKDSGEFWNTFFKPVNEATYQEQDNYGAGLDNFREFIKDNNIDIGKFLVDKQEINDRVTLTSTEKVEVFLATFDKDKMRHMIRGNNFTEKDVTDVINSLTKEEKAMGEYLVKHYEAQYKGINDIYKKLTGKDMPKIPGYSPIRLLSETIDTSRDVIESLLTKYNVRPSIRKGFTKERTGGAIQPLSLDAVNNFMFNLSRVEHYKAFVLPIRDINKLLSNPKLIEAIRQKKGNPFYQNMKSWLLDVSDTNPGVSFDQVDKIARLLRTRAADAMLGFNVVSAMKQPISVLNACAEIGISNVLNGIQQLTKSPVATTKFVYEKSPLVRNRKGQFDRVISELEQSKNIKQIIKQTKTKSDVIIGLLKFMDQQSVKAVWKGAYDQGLGKNMTDQQAIDYADKVVRKTQPMAGVKDLSKWFRGGTLSKMFTMFQNQINNNYNYYTHDILGKYRAGEIGVGKVAYRVAFSYVMPALLMGMISRGRLPKDKEGFRDLISFPIAGLFFVGSIVRNMIEGWDSFSIPPLSWANDVIKAGTMKKIPTKIKYGLSALAKVLGIPWNQPYRTVKGMIDYLGGATDDLRRLIYSEYALAEKKKKVMSKGDDFEFSEAFEFTDFAEDFEFSEESLTL